MVRTPHTKWGDDNRSHTKLCPGHLYMDLLIEYNGDDCHIHQQIITRLVIKEIVTTIGDNAFEDYEVLKELKLCNGLRQIGNYSFKGCVSLEKLK